jgi:hypothetical protein
VASSPPSFFVGFRLPTTHLRGHCDKVDRRTSSLKNFAVLACVEECLRQWRIAVLDQWKTETKNKMRVDVSYFLGEEPNQAETCKQLKGRRNKPNVTFFYMFIENFRVFF